MRKDWKKLRPQRAARKDTGSEAISVEQLADRLGIGRNQAYDAVRSGLIPALRIGRRWVIPRASFERLLATTPAGASTA